MSSNKNFKNSYEIYHFNIDVLYVMKARLFKLDEKLNKKLNEGTKENKYVCPDGKKMNANSQKCRNEDELGEMKYYN